VRLIPPVRAEGVKHFSITDDDKDTNDDDDKHDDSELINSIQLYISNETTITRFW
jgi:hypothetical protein